MDLGLVFIAVLFAAFAALGVIAYRSRARRRASLRRDESSGTYIWTDLDGSERRSPKHPDEPGGDWHSEGSGDGDGGDGGGGGD